MQLGSGMAPTAVGGPVVNLDGSIRKRKKKERVLAAQCLIRDQQKGSRSKWRSVTEQQLYVSKLIQALGRVRSTSSQAPKRGREIHQAADRALAISAMGKTRWSRAILMSNRVKVNFRKVKRQRVGSEVTRIRSSSSSKLRKKMRVSTAIVGLGPKNTTKVKRKTRVLGGLVPGCSKQPLLVVLEEATDYIAALQMQVRAMKALTQLLIGSSSAGN